MLRRFRGQLDLWRAAFDKKHYQGDPHKAAKQQEKTCATRFKALTTEGTLQAAKCMRCGEQDSFSHLLGCSSAGQPSNDESPEELLEYLMALVRGAAKGAPVVPVRLAAPEMDEISLTAEVDRSDVELSVGEASADSLSFEFTNEEN